MVFNNFNEIIIDTIEIKVIIVILIIVWGNKYKKEYNIPFILKLITNDEIVNPITNTLKKYISKTIGIPIIK